MSVKDLQRLKENTGQYELFRADDHPQVVEAGMILGWFRLPGLKFVSYSQVSHSR